MEADRQQTSEKLQETWLSGLQILQDYGWFILGGCILAYYVWTKLRPGVDRIRSSMETRAQPRDPAREQGRMEAMYAHRQRLQQRYDHQAAVQREKQIEKEEKKRQEKIEDWDRHQRGAGYKSRTKAQTSTEDSANPASAVRSRTSRPLRNNDYNPLTGDSGGSARFRPQRGPTMGGG